MTVTSTVEGIVEQIVDPSASERDNAVALHDYVREHVKFGFNDLFDAGDPEYTLAFGVGHCIPKTRLMAAVLRSAGYETHQHFVVLPKDILRGAIPAGRYWMIPREISHSYLEVQIEGVWRSVDTYIIDTPLLVGAQERLAAEGRRLGYGVRVDSVNDWDGSTDAFSQFDPDMMIEDHGRIEDIDAFFADRRYRNRVLGVSFNTMFKLMGRRGVAPINAAIDDIRR